MPAPVPEPLPRLYPAGISLVRRSARGSASAPDATTIDAIEAWLLDEAMSENDMLPLVESLWWRITATGLPLDRGSLHVGTLHPQVYGFAWNWERADGVCDELRIAESVLDYDGYRLAPLFRVIQHGETFRGDPRDPALASRHPFLTDLAGRGITEYIALPLRSGGAFHNAATVATRRPGGFSDDDLAALRRLLRVFALHVERHIVLRIAGNVLDTYLGSSVGARVLGGSIKRGAGEALHAIIWVSDLRGYTDLSERVSGPEMIALLNAYFERLAGAVLARGGQVLKFIGDGLLAVFPFAAGADETETAETALAAAEEALRAVDALNADPPAVIASIPGWRPLRTGIALHEGDVFFGNVGAPDRLDFTVIGRAVNEASRVEALTKTLRRPILVTEAVARRVRRPLEPMGEHPLRGLARPVSIFSPAS
jgi:adenylate cyclase